MEISAAHVTVISMPLKQPYSVAYRTFDSTENVFLQLETSQGLLGYGCAAPDEEVTGEASNEVARVLRDVATELLLGANPLQRERVLAQMRTELAEFPSARAAVDMALFDLLGRSAGLPLHQLLGGFRRRIRTSVTIGILPLEEMLERAREWIADGFRCLKLKGGLDLDLDIDKLLRLRQEVGPDIEIRFDANQGYSVDDSIRFVEATRQAHLELIEQPTAQGQPDLLGRVTRRVSIPVMADESLLSLRDAFRLARRDWVDMVNVKLMKVGGISEALQIEAVARAADLEVMIGCMDESALAISAGLHFALARPQVAYADLDGHLDLVGDPAQGAVTIRDGYLYPSPEPGLGCQPKL